MIEYADVPVADLQPFGLNPRQGDVGAITVSLEANGQYRPIVVNKRDMTILAGNHTYHAALALGWERISVGFVDVDDETARRIVLVDNRTNDLADYDSNVLAELLETVYNESGPDGLVGTGFNLDDFEDVRTAADYEGFVSKFDQPKTTDDCYTPGPVFEAVVGWVRDTYKLDSRPIVRPFWPGGDYRSADYPKDCVVIDNPPFSIAAEILRFYKDHGIDFFLFANHLTLFSPRVPGVCRVVTHASVIYENGAHIATSFFTNLDDAQVTLEPKLRQVIEQAQDDGDSRVKVAWPDCVVSAALLSKIVTAGVGLRLMPEECRVVGSVGGVPIYGGGYLLRKSATEKHAAAAAAAADVDEVEKVQVELLPDELKYVSE